MSIIYGPVPSWRLGRSLGIDLLSTRGKTCSFDCVYCQLGRTIHSLDVPKEFVPISRLTSELERVRDVQADYATFSGIGEPTLASNLGQAIEVTRSSLGLPVAVLTNSSLIPREDVRQGLAKADVVVAKLDAPTDELFHTINRPSISYTLDEILQGIRRFRREFGGKLARVALGTNNIGSLSVPVVSEEQARSLGKNASTCSYNDILTSDLILVFGCDITEDYPIIALKVREAVAKGSKLVTFNHRVTRMDPLANITLKVNPRTSTGLLRAMLNYILSYGLVDYDFVRFQTTGFESLAKEVRKYPLEKIADTLWIKPARIVEAIHLYIRAQRPVIIVNADTITSAELILISNLALITGNVGRSGAGIIALHNTGNAQGLIDMGVNPNYLPGQQPITDVAVRQKFEAAWGKPIPSEKGRDAIAIIQGIEGSNIQSILILGGDATGKIGNAIFEVPIFSVLIDTVFPETPPYPDVILPGATFAESEGTYTNCERRIQHLHRATSPPAGKENWEIISALSTSLGYPMNYPAVSSIYREIAKLAPTVKAGKSSRYSEEGTQWPFLNNGRFDFEDGLGRLRLVESESYETLEALTSLS